MRFAGPDVALFVVGALLFSGSVYGLWQIDGFAAGESAFGLYSIEWSEDQEDLNLASFSSEDSVTFDFDVEGAGVTHVLVTVACQHSPGNVPQDAAARISVDVTGPDNKTYSGEGTCGTPVTVDIPTGTATSGSVQADSVDEAERHAVENIVGTNATGAWSGEVTFTPANPFTNFVNYGGDVTATLTRAVPTATPVTG